MRDVKVKRLDGSEMTIQVDDDGELPAGYEPVESKAKQPANKAAAPRNKKA